MIPCDALWRSVLCQQAPPEAVDVGGAAWRLLLILLVLVGLLIVVARYGRQWLARIARTPPGELSVRAVCPLEPRRTLYLVRLRGRDYLIAASEAGLSLLRELEVPAGDAVPTRAADDADGAGPDTRAASGPVAGSPGDGP